MHMGEYSVTFAFVHPFRKLLAYGESAYIAACTVRNACSCEEQGKQGHATYFTLHIIQYVVSVTIIGAAWVKLSPLMSQSRTFTLWIVCIASSIYFTYLAHSTYLLCLSVIRVYPPQK